MREPAVSRARGAWAGFRLRGAERRLQGAGKALNAVHPGADGEFLDARWMNRQAPVDVPVATPEPCPYPARGCIAGPVPEAEVYTDDAAAYQDLTFTHAAVKHTINQYVDGKVQTNGIESFWAMLKRGHKGTYHMMSIKHLGRYVDEFVERHNMRRKDTIDQMAVVAARMEGKSLKCDDLIA
ncbi:MAG: transposase [Candidatus Tectomicrobia bacterium]|nr:transposase [Candidatus Tectomicrobia bacterium]